MENPEKEVFSTENFHFKLLNSKKEIMWNSSGQKKSFAIILSDEAIRSSIVEDTDIDELTYIELGGLELPSNSCNLIHEMAEFSWTKLTPIILSNFNRDINTNDIFDLHSLLLAAFPIDINTREFKSNAGAAFDLDYLDDLEDIENDKIIKHISFAGLGAILFENMRAMTGSESTNEEVLESCRNKWLCFV